MSLLAVERICFRYGVEPVLSDVSFDLNPGELLGLVGPNGAGKSTLLRLVLGLLRPEAGRILLAGDPVGTLPRREAARRVAFVPQEPGIASPFPVRAVVEMGRTPYRGRFQPLRPEDRTAVDQALEETGMTPFATRRITEISGGERRRVVLARAFAQATPLLVLDEPVANLDLLHTCRFFDSVRSRVDAGAAAVAAVHDLELAAQRCDRILVLDRGRVAATGIPEETLTPRILDRVFGVTARVEPDPDTGKPRIAVLGAAGQSDG